VAVSPVSGDQRIRDTLERIYAGMGAKMVVAYHEEGTDAARHGAHFSTMPMAIRSPRRIT